MARSITERRISVERLDSRGRSCLEWLEMGTWQEERNCRASIRYAYRNRNDHNSLADHSPLGQILTDRACGAVVAAFTMVGCRNETDMPIFKRIAVEKAADFRTANREQPADDDAVRGVRATPPQTWTTRRS